MLEIRNKTRQPIQLIVRSRRKPRSFTTLNVPGIGSGKNIILLEDEKATDYIDRVEAMGLISTQYLPNRLYKGE
jgi:hypothetical protein